MNTNTDSETFEYVHAQGNVQNACTLCGAAVIDFMNADRDENGHRPNQARHIAFHARLGF
jgi:hypothetical protein